MMLRPLYPNYPAKFLIILSLAVLNLSLVHTSMMALRRRGIPSAYKISLLVNHLTILVVLRCKPNKPTIALRH